MNKLSYFGTIASIAGSFLMAFGFVLFGYILFALGSISWLIVAKSRRDNSLFILNGFFFVANIIGLTRVLI